MNLSDSIRACARFGAEDGLPWLPHQIWFFVPRLLANCERRSTATIADCLPAISTLRHFIMVEQC